MEKDRGRMQELIGILDDAARTYYQESREIMSNLEYDKLYDELLELEKKTGTVLAWSPTIRVGYEILSELPKEAHEKKILSLDKTKEISVLREWLGEELGVLSWKLDGLTIVLTYQNGELAKAVTRGNGEVGEVVTANAKVFANVPLRIPYQGELILRGEAVITYSCFRMINEQIAETEAQYKNPRNLCSGSVRQLNTEITAQRKVCFIAFALVAGGEIAQNVTRIAQFQWLREQGFDVVEHVEVTKNNLEEVVQNFAKKIPENDFPSDGLVLSYNDVAYGASLGTTAKFPRDSIAFKWRDEVAQTVLREIEWSASRTGLINPVAIFDSVELEGTEVSRASVHNISIMESLELGIGDQIEVYKANMIIPQIADNLTRSGLLPIPVVCPVCGQKTRIKQENDVKVLFCDNAECLAKKIKSFTLFVSRDAMNVEGLSEATIEKLIAKGFIKEFADIFHVENYKEEIMQMDGFGEKSYMNLKDSIEKARHTDLAKFLYSLGIPNIGISNAKLICRKCDYQLERVQHLTEEELIGIDGIGEVIAQVYTDYMAKEENKKIIADLSAELIFEEKTSEANTALHGLTFVITGSVEHFANRSECKAYIESCGGKVTDSVTSNTNYLINNDNLSGASKNKKAKQLGVPIVTEKEFLELVQQKQQS